MGDPLTAQARLDALARAMAQAAGSLQGYMEDRLRQLGCPDPERYRLSVQLHDQAPVQVPRGRS